MTAFIFFEDPGAGAQIYNNNLTASAITAFTAGISIKNGGNNSVFNNSLRLNGNHVSLLIGDSGYIGGTHNNTVKNNIFSNFQYAYLIYQDAINNNIIDYNCVNEINSTAVGYWGNGFKTWTEWQILGNDIAGIHQNPLFISDLDLRLQLGSPCKDVGDTILFFDADKNGISRPQCPAWDIGAYEYVEATPPPDTTPPSAPTGLVAE